MLGLVLEAGQFVGVQGRREGVLVELEFLDQVAALGVIGGDENGHLPKTFLARGSREPTRL